MEMLKRLRKHIKGKSIKELQKEWSELESHKYHNGISADEFIKSQEKKNCNMTDKDIEIERLRIAFNTSFDQCTELIKRNNKLESEFAGYRIKHPSYESSGICQSCGGGNCIC